jgi:hypothetical protein
LVSATGGESENIDAKLACGEIEAASKSEKQIPHPAQTTEIRDDKAVGIGLRRFE